MGAVTKLFFVLFVTISSSAKADGDFTTFKDIRSNNFVEANFGDWFTIVLPSQFRFVDSSGLDLALAMMETKGIKVPRRKGFQLIKTNSDGEFLASITVSELKMQFGQEVMQAVSKEQTKPYRDSIEASVVKSNLAATGALTDILSHKKIVIGDEYYFMNLVYRRSFTAGSQYHEQAPQISTSFRYFNFDKSFSVVYSYVENLTDLM